MTGQVLMEGRLFPGDGVPGCEFNVTELEPGRVRIVLTSPYEGRGVVDEAELTLAELGPWLEGRVDY